MPTNYAQSPPKIFISYSSRNVTFVRKLDAALSIHGAQVFLDEREIRIGDSIPEAIFNAIESSSHLIFVISQDSASSRWVKDEISAAKMKQNSLGYPKILPILIDDCEVPANIRHIRYANFRSWEDPRSFSTSLSDVLTSVGLMMSTPTGADLRLFLNHYEDYLLAGTLASQLAGYVEGAYYADRWQHSNISFTPAHWDGARRALSTFIDLDESPIRRLRKFSSLLADSEVEKDGSVRNLSSMIVNLADDYMQARNRNQGPQTFIDLFNLALRVSNAIRSLQEEYLSLLAARFR
jgi:hypothetical protein